MSLLVAAIGATAAVFTWPDFRWKVLHDANFTPAALKEDGPKIEPPLPVPPVPSPGIVNPPPVGNATTLREVRATSVRSSSDLPPSRVATYGPEKAFDGQSATVWVEGGSGDGAGEWIEAVFPVSVVVSKIGIINGYGKGLRYSENERVRDAMLIFPDGSRQVIRLADNNQMQYFDISPTPTSSIRLVIETVYPGTRWTDAAIGEIRFWTRN